MLRSLSRESHRSRAAILIGLLCIALILLGATVQLVHAHPDGTIHSECALCVTAHVILATVAFAVFLSLLSRSVVPFVARQQKVFPRFEISFALSNRPPPSFR